MSAQTLNGINKGDSHFLSLHIFTDITFLLYLPLYIKWTQCRWLHYLHHKVLREGSLGMGTVMRWLLQKAIVARLLEHGHHRWESIQGWDFIDVIIFHRKIVNSLSDMTLRAKDLINTYKIENVQLRRQIEELCGDRGYMIWNEESVYTKLQTEIANLIEEIVDLKKKFINDAKKIREENGFYRCLLIFLVGLNIMILLFKLLM